VAARRNAAVELFWKVHPFLYRVSGGRIGGRLMNMPVLLLRTRGRRTGRERETALMTLPRDGAWVVVASVLGEPHHPGWYWNLREHPDAEIQVGRRTIPVRARETDGDERERLWRQIVDVQPDYAAYQRRTDRRIPVLVLEPR